jgi:hypothetical protein
MSKDKKQDRKLALRRETLRALDASQLAAAAGGAGPRSGCCGSVDCANSHTC